MIGIRAMSIADHQTVFRLISETPGVVVREADSLEAMSRYLERNPGLSLVATDADSIVVGCLLCGHDGRRGYLQHLVVRPAHRGQGIARQLVQHCITALQQLGIRKLHVDVLTSNPSAQAFWSGMGWEKRTDVERFSFISSGGPDT